MAKPKFDPGLFKEQREASGGDFKDISAGVYIANLEKASIGEAKTSGRLQAAFGFQIAEDDDSFANCWVFNNIGLTDGEGKVNAEGYKILGFVLNALKIAYDPTVDDIDKVLENAIPTKVKIKVTKKEGTDGVEYTGVKVLSVLEAPKTAKAGNKPDVDDLDKVESEIDPRAGDEINPGDWIELVDGTMCKILTVLDVDESDDGMQYITVLPQGAKISGSKTITVDQYKRKLEIPPDQKKTEKPIASKPSTAPPVSRELDEVEEEEEEEAAPQPQVGAKASGVSVVSGKTFTGEIKEILGDIVKIGDGKTIAKCKKDSIKLL